jgi:YD repeat-containing protein
MKLLLALVCLVFSTGVMAGDYFYTLDVDGSDRGATHYPTPDAACQVAYATDMAGPPPFPYADTPEPYASPTANEPIPPIQTYDCIVSWTSSKYGGDYSYFHSVFRGGNDCQGATIYNPLTGDCEAPDEEHDRKEAGDPTSAANVGFVSCGDPVNPANGNVFESETDYADQDGELRFVRSYNSAGAPGWTTTLDTHLYFNGDATSGNALVSLADGRSALFYIRDGKFVADGGQLGALVATADGWSYTSQFNETMTFDIQGRLVRWQRQDGRATTMVYSASGTVVTATDSLGHAMTYTTEYGLPLSLVAGNLTVDYTLDGEFRVASAKRSWPGHSTLRKYLYEDANNPALLTGIVDERGIRVSTWTYNQDGRALSASMAGGTGKFTFAYNADGSTTVTNPLGHLVVYRFNIVQGAKRITAIEGEPVAGCPASNSTFAYTANAQLDSRTDAVGHVTSFAYDALGRETIRIEGKGTASERTTTTTWDGTTFRPATVTTSDRATTYTYDTQGRLTRTTVTAKSN